jgi:putative restriction endonuclease
MLEALNALNGREIRLPIRAKDWPDRDRLAVRYQRFRATA